MAEESFPFQEIATGDRTVGAAMFAKHLGMTRTRGVIKNVDGQLALAQPSPAALSVDLATGAAFVGLTELRAYRNTLTRTLPIAAADPTNPRNDLVVLELDTSTSPDTRRVTALIVQGTPAASPTDPALTQTEAKYQLAIARVRVNALATSITDANLTDLRAYSEPANVAPAVTTIKGLFDDLANTFLGTFWHFPDGANGLSGAGPSPNLQESGGSVTTVANFASGAVSMSNGGTPAGQYAVVNHPANTKPYEAARNPRFKGRFQFGTGQSNCVQFAGFVNDSNPNTAIHTVAKHRAGFRVSGAGNIFAVSTDGTTEQTTDLSAFIAVATDATFECYSDDAGLSWKFAVNGTVRATHSANVPATTTGMGMMVGLFNNGVAGGAVTMTNFDWFYAINQGVGA